VIAPSQFALLALAAVGAGFVNALAGGGTLITFPSLMAAGLTAVASNVTNTIALCPGYVGGTLGQRGDLRGQRKRLMAFLPTAFLGGLAGAFILIYTGERVFRTIVPFLILFAVLLLALQDVLRGWLARRAVRGKAGAGDWAWALPVVALAAVYSGYFGAGASVIVLAVLGLFLDDTLGRLNALKQSIALSSNLAAAGVFALSGKVVWPVALVLSIGAVAGGFLGGRLASRMNSVYLRWIVVAIGTVVGVVYLVQG
jgi:uncharacterized membrane protein YfcA